MSAALAPAPVRWVSAEFFPVGLLVNDRLELGPIQSVRPAGSVRGVPFVVLVGTRGSSPSLPAAATLPVAAGPVRAAVEVAPASALGAGPVLLVLAPFLVGQDGSLALEPSDCSEFGFRLVGSSHELAAAAASLRALFGPAVLVGELEGA